MSTRPAENGHHSAAPSLGQASPDGASPSARTSLRRLLTWAFLLPLLAGVGLTGWLLIRNSRLSVDELTVQLRRELSDRVHDYLHGFLEVPHRLNELNVELLESGHLDPRDRGAVSRHLFLQLRHSEALSFVFLGTAAGGATGAGRNADGVMVVDTTDRDPGLGPVAGSRYEYQALPGGVYGPLIKASPGFDARQRPWFRAAVETRGPVWSDVYPFFAERTLALAASRPAYGNDGRLLGVFGVDLALAEVGDFLSGLEVGKTGLTFVLERSGELIASSTGETPFATAPDGSLVRIAATDSREPLVAATARFLRERFGELEAIGDGGQLDFDLGGDRQLVDVRSLREGRGLDWLIVVVVPESDFTGAVAGNTRATLWLCLAALVLAVALGMATANRISHPVQSLTEAAEAIAGGELDRRVEPRGVEELDQLARSFNHMAARLEHSFEDLEERVRQRTAELRDARDAAESASRAKTDFLSTVSHELRTPLSAILGYAELLADAGLELRDGAPSDAALYLRTIRDNGEHLHGLVRDLLDINRIEAGKLQLELRPCELEELLNQLESAFRPRAEGKGLGFEIVIERELPWSFVTDPLRLRQVLSNLLANAVLYTDRGSVTLRLDCGTDAPEEKSTASLVFRVEDTGPGISAADQERLFQRFDRLRRDGEEGFGLGLAITRQLTELMGGTLTLDSSEGRGSTFTAIVPVAGCDRWAVRAGDGWHHRQLPVHGYRRAPLRGRVLIADDSRALRELCEHTLRRWGLTCQSVANGRDAIRAVVEPPGFDVVLMDWQMSEVDGLEATVELRRRGIETPIVALTAAVMPGDRSRCLEAGCDDHLPKPLDFDDLHRLLSHFLNGSAASDHDPESEAVDEDRELLLRYVESLPRTIARLRAAVEDGDWQSFDGLLHKLAGTAGTYGLTVIFELAEALESAAAARDAARCGPLLEKLEASVREVLVDGRRTAPRAP